MSPHPDDLTPMAMTATIMGSAIMIIMTVAPARRCRSLNLCIRAVKWSFAGRFLLSKAKPACSPN
jgi:hypothetical protein